MFDTQNMTLVLCSTSNRKLFITAPVIQVDLSAVMPEKTPQGPQGRRSPAGVTNLCSTSTSALIKVLEQSGTYGAFVVECHIHVQTYNLPAAVWSPKDCSGDSKPSKSFGRVCGTFDLPCYLIFGCLMQMPPRLFARKSH